MIYNKVLKEFLLNKSSYERYQGSVDRTFIRNHYPELFKLFRVVDILYQEVDRQSIPVDQLEAGILQNYPTTGLEPFVHVLAQFREPPEQGDAIHKTLEALRSHGEAGKLALMALEVSEGRKPLEALKEAINVFSVDSEKASEIEELPEVDDDLDSLLDKVYTEGGLNWRLKSLNQSLGPLRQGDFGFLFARPETGKTTFLSDQATFMAGQCKEEEVILWFNNEEQGDKVKLRMYQSALGADIGRIESNRTKANEAFAKRTGRRIRLIDNAGLSKAKVEQYLHKYKSRIRLIIFDQIDKIKGFDADRDDLLLGTIYQWAREVAKLHAPVIGVSQAGGEGEGIKFLNMGHVANAKTAKQAEADWILGIGLDFRDPDFVRGFSICKNKLLGSKETLPEMRHGKFEVLIRPDIGRYQDIAQGTVIDGNAGEKEEEEYTAS